VQKKGVKLTQMNLIINKWWKLKLSTLFLLWKNKDNKHTMLLKPFFTLYSILINLSMVDFNLTIKNHIHDLATKLWSNNEQVINTLGILWILIIHLMLTFEPWIFLHYFHFHSYIDNI
jgi:hypothetical protein